MVDNCADSLFDFAYLGGLDKWYSLLNSLSNLALPENWCNKSKIDNPNNKSILENYIVHTFKRLAFERNAASDEDKNNIIYIGLQSVF